MNKEIIASAQVPNGRWGDLTVSVVRQKINGRDEYVWRNGWADPLVCDSLNDAMRYFLAATVQE